LVLSPQFFKSLRPSRVKIKTALAKTRTLKNGLKFGLKRVLNSNFRPFSFELKKIRFFEINFDLGFRVL